jgi:hypothetical protein
MSENAGLYAKYKVERLDGQPIVGPVFVLDLGSDPVNAAAALRGYAASGLDEQPDLATALWALLAEMESGQTDGPMHQALRTPKVSRTL